MRGREIADSEVAVKLRDRALGYSHAAVKIVVVNGEVQKVPYIQHYPPDTAAASLWLRNRQPKKWRDKTEMDLTGSLTIEQLVAGSMEDEKK